MDEREQLSKRKDLKGKTPMWVKKMLSGEGYLYWKFEREFKEGGIVSEDFAEELKRDMERSASETWIPKWMGVKHDGVIIRS